MATFNFLDKTGLGLVWEKVKALIPTKTSDLTNDSDFVTFDDTASTSVYGVTRLTDSTKSSSQILAPTANAVRRASLRSVWFGTCSTTATARAKTVNILSSQTDDFPTTINSGLVLVVFFNNGNSAANPTLNISLNSGSSFAFSDIEIVPSTSYLIGAGEVVEFLFASSSAVRMVNKTTATTTYYGLTKLSSSVSSTSTSLAATPSAVKEAYDLANSRVPSTRTVNGKALSSDITLTASDVGALPDDTEIPEYTAESPITLENDVIGFDGYSVDTVKTLLTNETVTTEAYSPAFSLALLEYSEQITADEITVTFNNVEYVLTANKNMDQHTVFYGDWGEYEPFFTNYPFAIQSDVEEGTYIFTESEGTYSVKIEANEKTTTTSEDFEVAVNSVVGDIPNGIYIVYEGQTTYNEALTAFQNGEYLICFADGGYVPLELYDEYYGHFIFSTGFYTTYLYTNGWNYSYYNHYAFADHDHGDITNSGDITTNATIANGDRLIINDESASRVRNSSITFGTSTNQYLANNGTWQDILPEKEVMVVTITRNGSTLISNKTYSEMASVLDGGGIVICQLGISFYNLSDYNDNVYMRFTHTEIYEDEGDYYAETEYLMIMHTGVITYSKESYTVSLALLPDTVIINPTNGQYLKYDGSVWRNSAPPTDTTYSLSMSGNRITLTPSSGTATYVDLPVYNGGVSS